jgi:hypothetical protein
MEGGKKLLLKNIDLLLVPLNEEVRNNENEKRINRYPLLQPSQPPDIFPTTFQNPNFSKYYLLPTYPRYYFYNGCLLI